MFARLLPMTLNACAFAFSPESPAENDPTAIYAFLSLRGAAVGGVLDASRPSIRAARAVTAVLMLVNCSSANRVGAFMMIYRVLDQGWAEDKALEEAIKIGLRGDELKKFARDYIAQRRSKQG